MPRASSASFGRPPRSPRCCATRWSCTGASSAQTGLDTGWKMTGCLRLAMQRTSAGLEYKRLATTARSFGLEMHLLSPAEVKSALAAHDDRRPRRRELPAERRPGKPLRHHPVARQRRTNARREDMRRRVGHRLRGEGWARHGGQDGPRGCSLARKSCCAPANGRARSPL